MAILPDEFEDRFRLFLRLQHLNQAANRIDLLSITGVTLQVLKHGIISPTPLETHSSYLDNRRLPSLLFHRFLLRLLFLLLPKRHRRRQRLTNRFQMLHHLLRRIVFGQLLARSFSLRGQCRRSWTVHDTADDEMTFVWRTGF